MSKFSYPKTKANDYVDMRKMIITNYNSIKKDNSNFLEVKSNVDFAYDRFFKDKIFEDDFYLFSDLKSIEIFLYKTKYFSNDKIKECISHEKEHLDVAKSIGHLPNGFYVMLLDDNGVPGFSTSVGFDRNSVTIKDLRKIAIAPKKLSLIDKLFI